MQLVVGLGNPGADYSETRHNVGFRVLAELARRLGLEFAAPVGNYCLAEGETPFGNVVLLKPLTYMNRSGSAVRAWAARNRRLVSGRREEGCLTPVVVCDDLNLPLGSLRIRARGSAGGQKGLESVISQLGGELFPRVRLGIAGGDGAIPAAEWSDYVLEPFTAGEQETVTELITYAADALGYLLVEGPVQAAARFNRRLHPEDL